MKSLMICVSLVASLLGVDSNAQAQCQRRITECAIEICYGNLGVGPSECEKRAAATRAECDARSRRAEEEYRACQEQERAERDRARRDEIERQRRINTPSRPGVDCPGCVRRAD